jgi:uncharacterized protein
MISIGPRKKVDRELIWWFEIPAADINRAQIFYETILRIKMTLDENEVYKTAFFPIFKDRIGGSIVQGQGYTPSGDGSKIYLNGHPDLQDILDRVESAGGKILIPKTKSASNFYAWILDSEGNKIALFSEE